MQDLPVDIAELAAAVPGLRLLVLHGSHARADAHEHSDWDFGYCADPDFDELELRWRLAKTLGTDAVDLVDLARAGGLIRYRVAREGKLLFEVEQGEFERFALSAIFFWLDAGPALGPAYQAFLAGLG